MTREQVASAGTPAIAWTTILRAERLVRAGAGWTPDQVLRRALDLLEQDHLQPATSAHPVADGPRAQRRRADLDAGRLPDLTDLERDVAALVTEGANIRAQLAALAEDDEAPDAEPVRACSRDELVAAMAGDDLHLDPGRSASDERYLLALAEAFDPDPYGERV